MSHRYVRRLLPVLGGLTALVATPASASATLPTLPAQVFGTNCVPASTATLTEVPWAQRTLRPERVWPLATGAGVTVAVLDSGVTGGGQLAGTVRRAGADCAGHGTFVASLVAARPADGTGLVGLAPNATILNVPTTAGTAAAAIRAALARHADVICLSTVASQAGGKLDAAVAAANAAGVPIVTPAYGESGNPLPASVLGGHDGVITVGGVGPDGKDATTPPAAARIDVYAPGKAVTGLGPRGGQYVAAGAGIATGFVAATVALVRQYRPDLTPAAIRRRLATTGYQQNTVTPAGTVDPLAAVTAATGGQADAARSPARRVSMPAPPAGPGGRTTALAVLGGAAGVVAAATGIGAVLRRGRRRRWRPA
ncbi:MAG TPA: S8 family serine peptidase [Actinocatenispora sp.]